VLDENNHTAVLPVPQRQPHKPEIACPSCSSVDSYTAMSSRTPSTDLQSSSAADRNSSSPSALNGKATTAPSKATQQDESVELKNMASDSDEVKTPLPIEEDIMQLARLGEVAAVQKLFESKKYTANYRDEEGITPLHVCCLSFDLQKYACMRFFMGRYT